jgi:hypothetical protein
MPAETVAAAAWDFAGVEAIVTHHDAPSKQYTGTLMNLQSYGGIEGWGVYDTRVLEDKVRYVGDAVAVAVLPHRARVEGPLQHERRRLHRGKNIADVDLEEHPLNHRGISNQMGSVWHIVAKIHCFIFSCGLEEFARLADNAGKVDILAREFIHP